MAIKRIPRQTAYGYPNPQGALFPDPVIAQRNPATTDFGDLGQIWINESSNSVFILTSISAGASNWENMGGGSGTFTSLTVTPGPISLTGTTTINTTGAADTTIGTGGTGVVAIGNATGNTFVTGTLTSSSSIFTSNGILSAGNTAASGSASTVQFLKSRSGGVITSGDNLGSVVFAGYDGTGYVSSAGITSTTSGTIAANRVAANLTFFTHPDSTSAASTRMTIAPAGNVTIAAPDSGVGLTVTAGGVAVTAGDVTVGSGDVNINTPGQGVNLPGPVQIITGAGAPGNGLALAIGDLYIRTDAGGATERIYVATAVGAWTNVTCAA